MAPRRASFISVASNDGTVTPSSPSDRINVFDDDFAEDYADSIHTSASRQDNPFRDPQDHPSLFPTADQDLQSRLSSGEPYVQPRNSVRKSDPAVRDSIGSNALPDTISALPNPRSTSAAPGLSGRTLSVNSANSFAIPQSPSQQDHSGPSHPYTLYPQGLAVSRSSSTATASTSQAAPRISSHRGPAHPYTMYPQTVLTNSSGDEEHQASIIPLGFPGHNQQFHRQLGPEGEEQDIIGPHGHAEQLPPYTRYPDNFNTKETAAGLLAVNGEATGVAQSGVPLLEMQERSRAEVFPHLADAPDPGRGAAPVVVGSNAFSEQAKAWREKTWKDKMKHKLWGFLRLWILLLVLGVIAIIAAVCGGVIGGWVAKRPKHPPGSPNLSNDSPQSQSQSQLQSQSLVTVTTTQYVDATPIGSSTSWALPTGSYDVALNSAHGSSDSCLPDSNEQSAWSCALPNRQSSLVVDIAFNGNVPFLTLTGKEQGIEFGTQAPCIDEEALVLVKDLGNLSLGPAYHFQTYYDKLVVIPATALPLGSKIKRTAQYNSQSSPVSTSSAISRRTTSSRVAPGEETWFCWWNSTYIEGFIYVDDDLAAFTSFYDSTSASTSIAKLTPTAPATTSSASPNTTPLVTSTTEYIPSTPSATQYATTTLSLSTSMLSLSTSTTCDFDLSQGLSSSIFPPYESDSSMPYTSVQRTHTRTPSPTVTSFPKPFKLQERRLSDMAPAPTCFMMSKGDDGAFTSVVDSSGDAITTTLDESDPSVTYVNTNRRRRGVVLERNSPPNGCYCQWAS